MKTLVAAVVLIALCSASTRNTKNKLRDSGTYLRVINGKKVIVIAANYYVTKGDALARKAAELGTSFWIRQSADFMLLPDEGDDDHKMAIPIRFELLVFETEDPLDAKRINDNLRIKDSTAGDIRNTFFITDKIEKVSASHSKGLTLGQSYTRVLRKYAGSVNVVAHEIAHTMGVRDKKEEGLMKEDGSEDLSVCESEIRDMLLYSFAHKENWYRNRYDPAIPEGKIIHISGRDPVGNGNIHYRKNKEEVEDYLLNSTLR